MTTGFRLINDDIVCDCGNDPTWQGFDMSDAEGNRVADDDPNWLFHYVCNKCGAVHMPKFSTDTDHDDPENLTIPNAEMAGGIFVAHHNGYMISVSLCDVTDSAGLPAVGDEPELASKVAQVFTGRQGLVFVTDVTQSVDGWDMTFVSKESLG